MSQNHAWFKKHPWIKHFNMTEYENISIRFLISYCKKPLRNYAWWVLGYYPKTVSTKIRKWKSLSHVWLWGPMECSPWNSPGQNTGVGNFSLLHGIFPTQGSNPSVLHCRQILYHLSHQGSPWQSTKPALNGSRGCADLCRQPVRTCGETRLMTGGISGQFSQLFVMQK